MSSCSSYPLSSSPEPGLSPHYAGREDIVSEEDKNSSHLSKKVSPYFLDVITILRISAEPGSFCKLIDLLEILLVNRNQLDTLQDRGGAG